MSTLIVTATEIEAKGIIDALGCSVQACGQGLTLYSNLSSHIIISRPGMANAALATSYGINHCQPEMIYSTGICGLHHHDSAFIGQATLSSQAIFADTGVFTADGFLDMQDFAFPVPTNHQDRINAVG